MSDVMADIDTTFMDRVRSRVRSLPGYDMEFLLSRTERTKDVEEIDNLFAPDRRTTFLRRLETADMPPGLPFDTSLVAKLPMWNDPFIALHLETQGDIPSSVILEVGEEFARSVAAEAGLLSSRDLITDCVAGSINFKLDGHKIATDVIAAILVVIVGALFEGVAKPKESPQVIEFVRCVAAAMDENSLASITIYTSRGEAFTCEKSTAIDSAKRLPDPVYVTPTTHRRPEPSYVMPDGSIEIVGFFDPNDMTRLVVTAPQDAVSRLDQILTELPAERANAPQPGTPYRIKGTWNSTMRRGRFLVIESTVRLEDKDGAFESYVKRYEAHTQAAPAIARNDTESQPREERDASR